MPPIQVPENYELPENDLRKICVMIGLPQETQQHEIPKEIVLQYYSDRLRADRIGLHFDDRDIWHIICRASVLHRIRPPQEEQPTVTDLFRAKKIKNGTPVLVTWKGKKNVPATLVGVKGDDAVVIIGDDGEERRISADRVHIAPDPVADKEPVAAKAGKG